MILLSHERQCFSRTNKTFGTTPTACVPFAVLSRIEILHILLEHFYDSQRNENAGSACRLHRRQPVARSQDRSVRSDSSSGGLPSSDRLHTSSRRIRAASWRCLAAAIVGKVHTRDGQEAVPGALLAAAVTGLCSCGIGRRRSNRAPRRLVTPTSSSRWGSAPAEPSSQALG
jgi:hypothetical protein